MISRGFAWICLSSFVLALAGLSAPARATTCGERITTDTILTADLDCSSGTPWHGLYVDADNITLDCAWHTVTGPPGGSGFSGVHVKNRTGVTVKNCFVESWEFGIKLEDSSGGNHLRNNTAQGNEYAISLLRSNDNTLTNNTAEQNVYGIGLNTSSRNLLRCNSALSNSERGFSLTAATDNTLRSNESYDNRIGFDLSSGSTGNTLEDNTADSSALGGFVLGGDSDGNDLSGNTANNNGEHGFRLNQVSVTTMRGNSATYNSNNGFHVVGTAANLEQNLLEGNSANLNGTTTDNSIHKNGIFVQYSSGSRLLNNEVNGNSSHGISLSSAVSGQLEGNTTQDNGGSGIGLYQSSDTNELRNNTSRANGGNGIYLNGSQTNTVEGNTAEDNAANGFADTTSGSGAGGTDNNYDPASNICSGNGDPSSPLGLCT